MTRQAFEYQVRRMMRLEMRRPREQRALREFAGWVHFRQGYASATMDLDRMLPGSGDVDRALDATRAEQALALYVEIQNREADGAETIRETWRRLYREARRIDDFGRPTLGEPLRTLFHCGVWA